MQWGVYEYAGVVMNLLSENSPAYFRISLENNDNTMIVNYLEDFDPNLEEQVNAEYKDIFARE